MNNDEIKEKIEIDDDINALIFESKYFRNFSLGINKGLQIFEIKGEKNPVFIDSSWPCLSLCYDITKSYLFAGFADGIIRVYKTLKNKEE